MSAGRAWALALIAATGWMAAPAAVASPPPAERLTLRLPDLGPNYATGVHDHCTARGAGDQRPRPVERLAQRFGLTWCLRDFHRSWVVPGTRPGPWYVKSAALTFADETGAQAAMDVQRQLAAAVASVWSRSLEVRVAPPALGDSAAAYGFEGIPFGMVAARKGAVVVWRSGHVVGLAASWDRSPALAGDTDALAAAQQRRIADPTPVARSDFDSSYVALDDPRHGAAVPWLGRRFAPKGGLPPLRFGDSSGPFGNRPGGSALRLRYLGRRGVTALELHRPRAWARYRRSPQARFVFSNLCAKRRIATRNGPAWLYADNDLRRCTSRPPVHRFAVQRIGGFVLVVNGPPCSSCWDRPRRSNPYETWRGLRAILGGIRPRPAPPS